METDISKLMFGLHKTLPSIENNIRHHMPICEIKWSHDWWLIHYMLGARHVVKLFG